MAAALLQTWKSVWEEEEGKNQGIQMLLAFNLSNLFYMQVSPESQHTVVIVLNRGARGSCQMTRLL